jgi:hypothetical protein
MPPQCTSQASQPATMTTRTDSGRFSTTAGTLYVSRPFRSKSSKKLRAMITFEPRKSHFDTTNESSGTNEFRVGNVSRPHSYASCAKVNHDALYIRASLPFSGSPFFYSRSKPTSPLLKQMGTPSPLPSPLCSPATPSLSRSPTVSSSLPLPFASHLQRRSARVGHGTTGLV